MAGSELAELVGGKSEQLDVEYKAWMDPRDPLNRANLARHMAALANHGGGYLVFGVDDTTREPLGATALDRKLFGQDEIAGIAKRYLDPCPAIGVDDAEHDGVRYPIVIVPSHGARPVCAKSGGPSDPKTGRPLGIQQGAIYIRAPGPQSRQIMTSEEWSAVLDRCLAHRADVLGRIMRQAMGQSGRPSARTGELLAAAVDATAADFTDQTRELAVLVAEAERSRVEQAGRAFCALGYALVGGAGEPIPFEDLRGLADRASVGMHRWAYNGWSAFFPINGRDGAPQIGNAHLLGSEHSYLEGMRLTCMTGAIDYWRIYEGGVATTAESYREDYAGLLNGQTQPYLTVLQVLWRIHSLLAHARLSGKETIGVEQVLVRMDWRGLAGRMLMWDHHGRFAAPGRTAGDRFAKTIALPWGDLRDTYFETLRRVSLPVFDLFPPAGWEAPRQWLTRERVVEQFAQMQNDGARLFED